MVITDVPDSLVCIFVNVNDQKIAKWVPFSDDLMSYELRPGSNGKLALWYRGNKGCSHCPRVSFVYEDARDFIPSPPPTAHIFDHVEVDTIISDTVSTSDPLIAKLDEHTAIKDTLLTDTVETVVFDTTYSNDLADTINDLDVWLVLVEAEYEFDKVRILRDYFNASNCTREDVFKALGVLNYDPSRLELCKHLKDRCYEKMREWHMDIAQEFFIYPHFRSEFQSLFK